MITKARKSIGNQRVKPLLRTLAPEITSLTTRFPLDPCLTRTNNTFVNVCVREKKQQKKRFQTTEGGWVTFQVNVKVDLVHSRLLVVLGVAYC